MFESCNIITFSSFIYSYILYTYYNKVDFATRPYRDSSYKINTQY